MLTSILVIVIILLLLIIWSIKQHREPRLNIHTDAPLVDLLPSLAGLTHATVVEGNAVDVFENGAFFDALLADMRNAQRSLHFETYLWEEGEISRRVTAALAERARRCASSCAGGCLGMQPDGRGRAPRVEGCGV